MDFDKHIRQISSAYSFSGMEGASDALENCLIVLICEGVVFEVDAALAGPTGRGTFMGQHPFGLGRFVHVVLYSLHRDYVCLHVARHTHQPVQCLCDLIVVIVTVEMFIKK